MNTQKNALTSAMDQIHEKDTRNEQLSNDTEQFLHKTLLKYSDAIDHKNNAVLDEIIETMQSAEIIYSDLDQTLTKSKYPITDEMADAIKNILASKKIVIVTGGKYATVQKNVLSKLEGANLENLVILPIMGNEVFVYNPELNQHQLTLEYEPSVITDEECELIESAIIRGLEKYGLPNDETVNIKGKNKNFPHMLEYDQLLERRGDGYTKSISFAFFGQKVPEYLFDFKDYWDSDREKRKVLGKYIEAELPEALKEKISLEIGGSTTIDFVRKGCDKSTGVEHFQEKFGLSDKPSVFLGDSFKTGGNDRPVFTNTSIPSIAVRDHKLSPLLLSFAGMKK